MKFLALEVEYLDPETNVRKQMQHVLVHDRKYLNALLSKLYIFIELDMQGAYNFVISSLIITLTTMI